MEKKKIRLIKFNKITNSPYIYLKNFPNNKYNINNNHKTPETSKDVKLETVTSFQKFRNLKNLNKNLKFNSLNISLPKTANNISLSSNNINQSSEHKILYEEIIRLKVRINKLKLELSFLKSLSRKKDDEIRELKRYKEDARYYRDKEDIKNLIFLKKIENENEIIKLKETYEKINIKMREQKEINNNILNRIREIEINEFKNRNEDERNNIKKNIEIFKNNQKLLEEKQKEIKDLKSIKKQYLENHKNLIKLEADYEKKLKKNEILKQKMYELKKECEKIQSKTNQIIMVNSSIVNDNKKLLNDKKNREKYLMKKTEVENKILLYESKTKELIDEMNNKEEIQKKNQNKKKEEKNIYENQIQKKPYTEDKQISLFESLIGESKIKQNVLMEQLRDLIKENYISNEQDDSDLFEGNNNEINSPVNDINIEENEEKIKTENDFIFLLNIMLYIGDINKDKIKNIFNKYKDENYSNNFINELSKDILLTINNQENINNLQEILQNIFEHKYKNDKISFLDNVINDIYILNNGENKIILFNKNEENILLEKMKNYFSNKINKIISKLEQNNNNNNNESIISYEKIKSIFIEEELYNQENEENIKLFQYFIFCLKKKEKNLTQKNSLKEFSISIIQDFFKDFKEKIFIDGLKKFLEEKNMNLTELVGQKENIDTSEFIKILEENKFNINSNVDIDMHNVLQKYKMDENSKNINMALIQKDLNNKVSNE